MEDEETSEIARAFATVLCRAVLKLSHRQQTEAQSRKPLPLLMILSVSPSNTESLPASITGSRNGGLGLRPQMQVR
jgi:hypothetical protein